MIGEPMMYRLFTGESLTCGSLVYQSLTSKPMICQLSTSHLRTRCILASQRVLERSSIACEHHHPHLAVRRQPQDQGEPKPISVLERSSIGNPEWGDAEEFSGGEAAGAPSGRPLGGSRIVSQPG